MTDEEQRRWMRVGAAMAAAAPRGRFKEHHDDR